MTILCTTLIMLFLFVYGLISLAVGRLKLSANIIIEGDKARFIGSLTMAPLLLVVCFGLLAWTTNSTHFSEVVALVGCTSVPLVLVIVSVFAWREKRAGEQFNRSADG